MKKLRQKTVSIIRFKKQSAKRPSESFQTASLAIVMCCGSSMVTQATTAAAIGLATIANTFEDVKRIYSAGADYIGCGPFRFTTTKKKLSPILGLDGYSRIIEQMNTYGIYTPIIAIGGILLQDVSDIMQTGVSGVAVSGAILNANNGYDPVTTMKRFINELKSSNK